MHDALTRRVLLENGVKLAALSAAPAIAAAAVTADARLLALLEAADAADARLDPMSADRRGTADGPAFVDPLGDGYGRQLRADKEQALRALARIDRAALTPPSAIAYDVFRYRLQQLLDRFTSGLFDVRRRAPLDPSFGPQVEVADFVSGGGARFETVADYDRGLERLEGFAGYLRTAVVRLREGVAVGQIQPRIIVERVLAQIDAMLALPLEGTPFYAAVTRMPASFPAADRARLTGAYRAVVRDRVLAGYRLWREYLGGEYLARAGAAPGRWAMKDGAALYASELAGHTTTDTPAATIHRLGLSEVARIRAEMEAARVAIGFKGDLPALFDDIRTDRRFYARTPDELLGRFKAIEAKIWPSIPRLFARRPNAPFEVRGLPALGEQRGTGYYRPGPPDGRSPGILYFNMAMRDTRPIPTLETLTLHEGIPGHHFQINLARENDALPPILRFGSSTAYGEGWGLYAESLGRELGMFTDPLQWFGHLDMEMLRAVRLVVDTGLHAERWDRQRAIDYMLANTSMAPRDVAVEIDRYIAAPGQACAYKMGELKLQELRTRAQTAFAARFDIRQYHDQVLGTGALPLAVLENKIDRWITSRGQAASGFAG